MARFVELKDKEGGVFACNIDHIVAVHYGPEDEACIMLSSSKERKFSREDPGFKALISELNGNASQHGD